MRNFRIGLLLGLRQVQRASKWTTILIIFVMMLTFLNLIAVSGILVGLIAGAEQAVRAEAIGDIVVSELAEEDRILETETILRELDAFPEIESYSIRFQGGGTLEANYKERRSLTAERDVASVQVTGIDPALEDNFSGLSNKIIDGEYLNANEEGYILIGAYYIEEYAQQFGDIFDSLSGVKPGDTVRLTTGNTSKEFIVKGIIQSKVDDIKPKHLHS
jgi:ABC-type lipoprotein release transport system permease subunit